MWANRGWVGRYFPSGTKPGSELSPYSTWCSAVEGNTTFYASPPADTVAHWSAQTSEDFRFCFKVPREITHDRRLRNCAELLDRFLDLIAPLGDRLGPIQLQLPASFEPADLPFLEASIRSLSTQFSWAVEVRHPEFFVGGKSEGSLDDVLRSAGINRVILDSRALFTAVPNTPLEHEAWERKPRLPVRPVATSSQPIVRLIGQRNPDTNLSEWNQWYPKLAQWADEGLTPHVFTHTPDNLVAPSLARSVWLAVEQLAKQPLVALPEPIQAERQLDLFD